MKNIILKVIKEATILLDGTADMSPTDQIAFVVRDVKVEESEAQIKESVFLPTARENRQINY